MVSAVGATPSTEIILYPSARPSREHSLQSPKPMTLLPVSAALSPVTSSSLQPMSRSSAAIEPLPSGRASISISPSPPKAVQESSRPEKMSFSSSELISLTRLPSPVKNTSASLDTGAVCMPAGISEPSGAMTTSALPSLSEAQAPSVAPKLRKPPVSSREQPSIMAATASASGS